MSDKRIHESLTHAFHTHRLVFWYDPANEWRETAESFEEEGVETLVVEDNAFGTKVRILSDKSATVRFLIYIPSERPPDGENWLLDLLFQGHEFKADRASLALQEVGLPYEFRPLAEDHREFFRNQKRVQALKGQVSGDDDPDTLRLKMMAILAGTQAEVDTLMLECLKRAADGDMWDPVDELFKNHGLAKPFWRRVSQRFDYVAESPSVKDFAVTLFRGADPLDPGVPARSHSRVFLQRWKDSQSHCRSFRTWSATLAGELNIMERLDADGDRIPLGDADAFECFERFTLHRLCKGFEDGVAAETLRAVVLDRRQSFWYPDHAHGYEAILQALDLRELLHGAELNIESIETGFTRYRNSWWKIDRAYRRFYYHRRQYGQVNVMERIDQWVGKTYVNNFLLPLADRWSDRVRALERWEGAALLPQRRFFDEFVKPFLDKGQKIFVIVSDALRYEAAAEFADRLRSENRFTAELEAMLSSLPSYTQLGMASLLPGTARQVDPENLTVAVDGRSATGTENRSEILHSALDGRGVAVQAEHFLEMNTKTEGRALMREHDVVYIYHNVIDKTGDTPTTEAKTFDAVEQAFDEILQIVKKVANINANNMLLTADHGFLFQQEPVHAGDATPLPTADRVTNRNRRFVVGTGFQAGEGVKVFTAAALGLPGEWECAFPLSLGRFPLQGSGKRYVHGGFSLQEVVLPVVRIHKARADDTGRVSVELMRAPAKITTGQIALSLYQEKPVTAKLLPRELRIGVFAKDDTPLSETKTIQFDSADEENRKRETNITLVLSRAADDFNNKMVEIRLEETLSGTSQSVTYKTHSIKLQKPFASDFDEY